MHARFQLKWALEIVAQSICTHYSSLSGRPDIFLGSGTLKKGPKYGLQKAGCKKHGSEEARLILLFLNNIDPVYLDPAFCNPYVGPFFQTSRP